MTHSDPGLDAAALARVPAPKDGFELVVHDGVKLLARRDSASGIALNDSAASIWRLCDGKRSVGDILARLGDDFSVAPESLARGVAEAIENLARAGALDLVDAAPAVAVPAATPRGKPCKLTIGMAAYDDYDGVYFTVQALRMYHPEIADDVEFLVIDNNPEGPCAEPMKQLERAMPNYRYVPHRERVGTMIRDMVFEEAAGEVVLCMDCHVFVVPGAIARLIAYCDAASDSADLLQGPMIYDDLQTYSTHFKPQWRGGMYGIWQADERGRDPEEQPFEIPMQGLGLFACRRAAWPGFNKRFKGFGGEEGYIHEKIRRAGGRTMCLPFLRWMHRFNRPMGVPYENRWDDRIWNYMVGFRELGWDVGPIEEHFTELLGAQAASAIFTRIRAQLAQDGVP